MEIETFFIGELNKILYPGEINYTVVHIEWNYVSVALFAEESQKPTIHACCHSILIILGAAVLILTSLFPLNVNASKQRTRTIFAYWVWSSIFSFTKKDTANVSEPSRKI